MIIQVFSTQLRFDLLDSDVVLGNLPKEVAAHLAPQFSSYDIEDIRACDQSWWQEKPCTMILTPGLRRPRRAPCEVPDNGASFNFEGTPGKFQIVIRS